MNKVTLPGDAASSTAVRPKSGKRRADGGQTKESASRRLGLASGPLGIVLAAITLIETIMGLVVRSGMAAQNATFIVYAMVALAFFTLFGFFFVWTRLPPGYLYPPSQFRDDRSWLTAVRREDLEPSEPLVLLGEGDAGPTPKVPQKGPADEDGFQKQMTADLQGGYVTSTLVMVLAQHLRASSNWVYLAVDVEHVWLLSRLFIFVSLFRVLRGFSCMTFVSKVGETQKLVAMADPAKFCSVVAARYPWFNEELAHILTARRIPIFMSTIDEHEAVEVMTEFLHRLQSPDPHEGDPDWARLSSGTWERSRWLDAEMVRQDLAAALFEPATSVIRQREGVSDEDFAFEVIGRDAPFVALVSDSGAFLSLYDKRRLLEGVKNRLRAERSGS